MAESVDGLGDGGIEVRLVGTGDVEVEDLAAIVGEAGLLCCRKAASQLAGAEPDVPAEVQQLADDFEADAAIGSGDEGGSGFGHAWRWKRDGSVACRVEGQEGLQAAVASEVIPSAFMQWLKRIGALFVLTAFAPTQVLVVDAAGGPGSQYRDLKVAVQAAPDGATLIVRSGRYRSFRVSGKGLAIVGLSGVRVADNDFCEVVRTRPGQSVIVRNLEFAIRGLWIDSASGAVVLDRCRDVLDANGGALQTVDVGVRQSPRVHIDRCQFTRIHQSAPTVMVIDSSVTITNSTLLGPTRFGYVRSSAAALPAIQARRSRVWVSGATVIGGAGQVGAWCNFCPTIGGDGGDGIGVDGGAVTIYDSRVEGGAGGAPACNPQTNACARTGDGGDGIDATNADVTVLGPRLLAGKSGGPKGFAGVPVRLAGKTQVRIDPGAAPPRLSWLGEQRAGGSLTLRLQALPNAGAVLVASRDPLWIPLGMPFAGGILASPEQILGPYPIDSMGRFEISWSVPATLPIGPLRSLQCVTFGAGRMEASNPVPFWISP